MLSFKLSKFYLFVDMHVQHSLLGCLGVKREKDHTWAGNDICSISLANTGSMTSCNGKDARERKKGCGIQSVIPLLDTFYSDLQPFSFFVF
jgi:hypothetical protein